jgi:hypothetical protein
VGGILGITSFSNYIIDFASSSRAGAMQLQIDAPPGAGGLNFPDGGQPFDGRPLHTVSSLYGTEQGWIWHRGFGHTAETRIH